MTYRRIDNFVKIHENGSPRYSNLPFHSVASFPHTHTHASWSCKTARSMIKKVNKFDVISLSSHLPSRVNASFSFLSRISLTFSYTVPIVPWLYCERLLYVSTVDNHQDHIIAPGLVSLMDFIEFSFLLASSGLSFRHHTLGARARQSSPKLWQNTNDGTTIIQLSSSSTS